MLGLKWNDVDWLGKTASIRRGVVKAIVDDVKSRHSARNMACADELLDILKAWKQAAQFADAEDWILVSPVKLGLMPLGYTLVWNTFRRHIRPRGDGARRQLLLPAHLIAVG